MSWLGVDAEILVSCETVVSAAAIFETEGGSQLVERDSSRDVKEHGCGFVAKAPHLLISGMFSLLLQFLLLEAFHGQASASWRVLVPPDWLIKISLHPS